MKIETGKATSNTAYGMPLPTPITFDFKWEVYEDISEVKPLTDKELLTFRTAESKANARSAAQSAAWSAAGIVKPTAENDEQVRLKDIYKTLMTAKLPNGDARYTEESAREMAETVTGCKWAE
jgi:hypothetical protein